MLVVSFYENNVSPMYATAYKNANPKMIAMIGTIILFRINCMIPLLLLIIFNYESNSL